AGAPGEGAGVRFGRAGLPGRDRGGLRTRVAGPVRRRHPAHPTVGHRAHGGGRCRRTLAGGRTRLIGRGTHARRAPTTTLRPVEQLPQRTFFRRPLPNGPHNEACTTPAPTARAIAGATVAAVRAFAASSRRVTRRGGHCG